MNHHYQTKKERAKNTREKEKKKCIADAIQKPRAQSVLPVRKNNGEYRDDAEEENETEENATADRRGDRANSDSVSTRRRVIAHGNTTETLFFHEVSFYLISFLCCRCTRLRSFATWRTR